MFKMAEVAYKHYDTVTPMRWLKADRLVAFIPIENSETKVIV